MAPPVSPSGTATSLVGDNTRLFQSSNPFAPFPDPSRKQEAEVPYWQILRYPPVVPKPEEPVSPRHQRLRNLVTEAKRITGNYTHFASEEDTKNFRHMVAEECTKLVPWIANPEANKDEVRSHTEAIVRISNGVETEAEYWTRMHKNRDRVAQGLEEQERAYQQEIDKFVDAYEKEPVSAWTSAGAVIADSLILQQTVVQCHPAAAMPVSIPRSQTEVKAIIRHTSSGIKTQLASPEKFEKLAVCREQIRNAGSVEEMRRAVENYQAAFAEMGAGATRLENELNEHRKTSEVCGQYLKGATAITAGICAGPFVAGSFWGSVAVGGVINAAVEAPDRYAAMQRARLAGESQGGSVLDLARDIGVDGLTGSLSTAVPLAALKQAKPALSGASKILGTGIVGTGERVGAPVAKETAEVVAGRLVYGTAGVASASGTAAAVGATKMAATNPEATFSDIVDEAGKEAASTGLVASVLTLAHVGTVSRAAAPGAKPRIVATRPAAAVAEAGAPVVEPRPTVVEPRPTAAEPLPAKAPTPAMPPAPPKITTAEVPAPGPAPSATTASAPTRSPVAETEVKSPARAEPKTTLHADGPSPTEPIKQPGEILRQLARDTDGTAKTGAAPVRPMTPETIDLKILYDTTRTRLEGLASGKPMNHTELTQLYRDVCSLDANYGPAKGRLLRVARAIPAFEQARMADIANRLVEHTEGRISSPPSEQELGQLRTYLGDNRQSPTAQALRGAGGDFWMRQFIAGRTSTGPTRLTENPLRWSDEEIISRLAEVEAGVQALLDGDSSIPSKSERFRLQGPSPRNGHPGVQYVGRIKGQDVVVQCDPPHPDHKNQTHMHLLTPGIDARRSFTDLGEVLEAIGQRIITQQHVTDLSSSPVRKPR